MTLPTEKQTRIGKDPRSADVLLAGMPKVGKTTLLSGWYPDTTLIIDTQGGTTLLEGEHYVQHIQSWAEFVVIVDELLQTDHDFQTVGIDLVDDLWLMCDEHHAGKNGILASATDDYSRSLRTARAVFSRQVGRLLQSNIGVWFLSHVREERDGDLVRYQNTIPDKDIRKFIHGACEFIFLAERLGPKRILHTKPSAKFEAGSRVVLPEPMDLDARQLATAMLAALKPETTKKKQEVASV